MIYYSAFCAGMPACLAMITVSYYFIIYLNRKYLESIEAMRKLLQQLVVSDLYGYGPLNVFFLGNSI